MRRPITRLQERAIPVLEINKPQVQPQATPGALNPLAGAGTSGNFPDASQ